MLLLLAKIKDLQGDEPPLAMTLDWRTVEREQDRSLH